MHKQILNEQTQRALERATSTLTTREYREEQLQMCQFLRRYLDFAKISGHVAAVEAGTGVGKSYGYLVPIYEYLNSLDEKSKFVIATNTISLQEQLIRKDVPKINSLYPGIKFAKAKGRNNYVCLYKLNNPEDSLFSCDNEKKEMIREWLDTPEGKTGDRSDVNFELSQTDWHSVGADLNDCYGATCPYSKDCYYNVAKAKVESADVIITTHAMVLTDYILGTGLPDYTHLILDEAHNFSKNATSILTVNISRRRIYRLIGMSRGKFCQNGFRQGKFLGKVTEWQKSLTNFTELFFQSLTDGRVLTPPENELGHLLLESIRQIFPSIDKSLESSKKSITKTALKNLNNEAISLMCDLETWLDQSKQDTVYWVEKGEACFVPINIGDMLAPLWQSHNSILTSATLCVAKNFTMIRESLNLPKEYTYTYRLESPFNYQENGLVYVPTQAPSPKSNGYVDYVVDTTAKALNRTGGKTFVLFTSYAMMKKVADELSLSMGDRFTFLVQGTDSRERLLENYRSHQDAVLFGTDTFWEGIDENINCVILTKLPFAVPTSPVEEARYELIKSRGKNPFIVYALPQCALKLKQGAGRLIRHQHKRGVIIICDPRIAQNWGKQIVQTLPDMKWTGDISMMDSYLENRAG